MHDSDTLSDLLRRCRAGDSQALGLILGRFAERLARIAERQLSARVARREGPDDVVQSVFRTFYRRSTQGELQINDATHLWHLLVRITVLKVRAKGRFHSAACRDIEAEVGGEDEWLLHCADRDPGPEEAAVLLDLMAAMVQGLDPLHARVLELRMQGFSVADIANEVNRTRQAVYRILDLFEKRLRQASGEINS